MGTSRLKDGVNIETVISSWKSLLFIICILWAALYLPGLGVPEVQGEEARRILPAIEMLETNDWLVPSIGGQDYYNKPPGINWPIALSFLITGQKGEFVARLPSILTLFVFMVMIVFTRGGWLSRSGRFIAAVAIATNVSMLEKGRLIEIEAIYVCFTGIALLCWLNGFSKGNKGFRLWLVPGLVLAYSMLIKGPISVIVFYCTVVSVLCYFGRKKQLVSVGHIAAVALIIGVPALWYYLAQLETSSQALGESLSGQMMSRVFGRYDFKVWIARLGKGLVYFLPWLLFLPGLWDKRVLSAMTVDERKYAKALRLGVILGFVLLNLMPRNHPRYVMPVIATASLAVGLALSNEKWFDGSGGLWRRILCALSVCAVFSCVAGFWVTFSIYAVLTLAFSICLCLFFIKYSARMNNPVTLTFLTGLVVVAVMLQYAVFGLKFIHAREKHRPSKDVVIQKVPAGHNIYAYATGFEPVLYYIREPFDYIRNENEIDRDVDYLLTKEKVLKDLEEKNIWPVASEILYEFPFSRRGKLILVHRVE